MLRKIAVACLVLAVFMLVLGDHVGACAQGIAGGRAAPLITQPINESLLVALAGNTRPEANAANDRGAVAGDLPMEHIQLQLRRSPEQQEALDQLINQLHDRTSPRFHQWLSAQQFGAEFGLAAADLATITKWLERHGFVVNSVLPNAVVIDFSGTAGQVREAFHTEIHYLEVDGVRHIANMSNPQIPSALAPAVVGIISLNDFKPIPGLNTTKRKPPITFSCTPECYFVVPADLATIYNFNPLFAAGITGVGQTIYLIEDTNLYTTADWTTFRSTFGLSGYTGASLNTVHPAPPSGSNNCTDPGDTGDDVEAILDAEYASAAAPNAAIVLATCTSLLTAIQNLINGANPPSIITMSYATCETAFGASNNAAYSSIYQQGVVEGTSIFVAAGDWDAAVCDMHAGTPAHGVAVNGLASTPYNVAVGGTDFGDVYAKTASTYWNSNNTATYQSAKSYIPEIPWNDSCASQLYAAYEGFSTTYGPSSYCNSLPSGSYNLSGDGGSGGPSGCATGGPSTYNVVSGTCAGYPKPSWQSGIVGNPNDGVRDLPDVSLFAADGQFGHAYIFCYSKSSSSAGALCTFGGANGNPVTWSWTGGTSFASPIMAGIQALVNQHAGGAQGNPNVVYYARAKTEYGTSGSSSCNSSNGNTVGSACIFYDVTQGDNAAPCTGSHNCYDPSGTYGVLSTSDSAFAPAYRATTGWDFATGIGTVNAYNLVMGWSGEETLSVTTFGASGSVTSSPAGINCVAPTCSGSFPIGTKVRLTAIPNTGMIFTGWSGGGCSGTGTCTVIMNAGQNVVAFFGFGEQPL